jgi:transcriptional regulatory protein RtcR
MASRPRKNVVVGFLGTTLDAGKGAARWDRWRPTVSLFQQDDLLIHRLELLHSRAQQSLADVIAEDIRRLSPETEVRSRHMEIGDAWDFEQMYGALHDFARGYPFDPEREDYLVHITTGTHVAQICLFLLTEARYLPARLIQTSPARGSHGGEGTYAIIDLDVSKYDKLASRFRRETTEGLSFLKSGIDTKNAAFNKLIERIERVAIRSPAPILLMGPTGAGKSQLARRIYELKRARRQISGEFAEINCATLRGDTAMSTLFGHTKGAFTGAQSDRPGLLRKAHGGMLFLDEIGELGGDEQAMLLRAIEEKVFYPVGSDREVRSEFQLLAGTNRDLASDVARGAFREDLLARINLWTFRLPFLRERPEDIPANLDYEIAQASRAQGVNVTFSREARERFLTFATSREARWPGNFRDFNAAVTRMATLTEGGRITAAIVEEEIERLREMWSGGGETTPRARGAKEGGALVEQVLGPKKAQALDRFDRVQLEDVLSVCRSARSLSDAGRVLFAQSRQSRSKVNDADRLRKYLARHDLAWSDVQPAGDDTAS